MRDPEPRNERRPFLTADLLALHERRDVALARRRPDETELPQATEDVARNGASSLPGIGVGRYVVDDEAAHRGAEHSVVVVETSGGLL